MQGCKAHGCAHAHELREATDKISVLTKQLQDLEGHKGRLGHQLSEAHQHSTNLQHQLLAVHEKWINTESHKARLQEQVHILEVKALQGRTL